MWLALILASLSGFGLGGAIGLARAYRIGPGSWEPALVQAHGHIQVFGWGGLMVLGVAVHFLPRLRGGSPLSAAPTRTGLVALASGLVLRPVTASLLPTSSGVQAAARVGFAISGPCELVGAGVLVFLLARMFMSGPRGTDRPGLVRALPVFALGLVALLSGLAANAAGTVEAGFENTGVIAGQLDAAASQIGLFGFLVVVALAMSERTLPLYFRTRSAPAPLLWLAAGMIAVGVALRVGSTSVDAPIIVIAGDAVLGIGVAVGTLAVGVFGPRRRLARPLPLLSDPTHWHVLTAYAWLMFAAALMIGRVGSTLLGRGFLPWDPVAHSIGAGFITILIFGMGARLLPGFSRRPLRRTSLVWATLVLGNIAALLRVTPVLLGSFGSGVDLLLALAGVAGMSGVGAFAWNIAPTVMGGRGTEVG